MNLFFFYIRVFVFLGVTLAGIQVPAFVDQYGKSLESHLTESRIALNEFQDDADKHFDGSIENLIAHYRKNKDQVFYEGSHSIKAIYDRNLMLRSHFEQYQSSSLSAYTQALFFPVPDVRRKVWERYSYTIQLKPIAIVFGLITALILTLGIELLFRLLCKSSKLLNKRFQTTP